MKNRLISFLPLIVILIIAVFFRFYNLSNVPPHPSLDEVSEGYNAYSILYTGKDEYGYKMPVLLRAYDDYRPALYTYLVIPFVKIFGLTTLSVRFPSAILSILTVVSVYYFSKLIFNKKGNGAEKSWLSPPILITFLFAISPWDVYISRLGHEVNAFFAFFVFGITFFFSYLAYKKNWLLFLSTLFLSLSFDAYQNGKIFIPIIVMSLFVLYFKKLIKDIRILVLNVILGVVLVLPILITTFQPNALIRFQGTNLFSNINANKEQSAINIQKDKIEHNYVGLILDNRRLIYPKLFLTAYFSHFNAWWLFANGGTEPFKVPNLGLLYPLEGILLILGVYNIFKKKALDKEFKIFLVIWIFSSILPAAITTGYPHAMRIFQLLPALNILSGVGAYFLVSKLRGKFLLIVMLFLIISALTAVISLYQNYFIEFPIKDAYQFQYGIKDSLSYAAKVENKYDAIYVSNKENLFQSYMFYLFFAKYNPNLYQKQGGTKSGGFDKNHRIGKYFFGSLSNHLPSNSLVLSNAEEFKEGRKIKAINYPTGQQAIWISEVK